MNNPGVVLYGQGSMAGSVRVAHRVGTGAVPREGTQLQGRDWRAVGAPATCLRLLGGVTVADRTGNTAGV